MTDKLPAWAADSDALRKGMLDFRALRKREQQDEMTRQFKQQTMTRERANELWAAVLRDKAARVARD